MDVKNVIAKTKARANFSALYNEVREGKVYIVSDRGSLEVVLAPVSLLEKNKVKTAPPLSKTEAFNVFKGRKEMKNSLLWEEKVRKQRVKSEYGK